MAQREDPVWEAFDLEELGARREESGLPWLPFLDVATMNAGLYVLAAGGEDAQRPHELDELYYVVSGRATMQIEGDTLKVGPGGLIYVRARAAHRFHSIEEDLQVLVFFSIRERSEVSQVE
jgi:mannose-6-phosphate isomerase-like protein (cupin superfamily)